MKNKNRLISKKNEVHLIEIAGKNYIHKKHSNSKRYHIEKSFYQSVGNCDNFLVPSLLSFDDRECVLILEYIEGKMLLETLEEYEKQENCQKVFQILVLLIEWLKCFNKLNPFTEVEFNDVNFRNFIINGDLIYGIDFEDIKQGDYHNDIIKVLAMYLTYDPAFSCFKVKVVKRLKQYLILGNLFSLGDLDEMVRAEIEVINSRRKKIRGNK